MAKSTYLHGQRKGRCVLPRLHGVKVKGKVHPRRGHEGSEEK